VRIAGTLVEGNGVISTSGGSGAANGANGPIEIQAFVQDAFTGTAPGAVRGNPVAAPLPTNLPTIRVTGVQVSSLQFFGGVPNPTGSLVAPDVVVDPPVATPLDLIVNVFTNGVPNGDSLAFGSALQETLRFRAVGTDGSVVETDALVVECDCTTGEGEATGTLAGLNPGATYQIVVTPRDGPFALARGPEAAPLGGVLPIRAATHSAGSGQAVSEQPLGSEDSAELAARWARALGADPRALEAQVARVTVQVGRSSE
jgi:hypothetical protein